jgi:replicative DNA helicase
MNFNQLSYLPWIIYENIVETVITKRNLDILVFFMAIKQSGKLELAGGSAYINDIISKRESTTNATDATDQLRNEFNRRKLKDICDKAIKSLDTEYRVENVLNELDKQVYAMQENKPVETMVDIPAVIDSIIEKANNVDNYGCYGYSFGLHELDYLTGGLECGKTYVVGATKKSGKSKFVINTIHALHQREIKSLFLSLEMNGEGVVKEIISRFNEIDNSNLRRRLDRGTYEKIHSLKSELSYLEIDTQSFLTTTQIRHKVRQASQRGVKVIFIDYLQRLDFQMKGSGQNFATIISNTVSQIADIAKEFNVAILFLSQLANRADNEQATIADLKDSGGIAEGVDCILILNNQDRISKDYEHKTNQVWISIEQRSGASGLIKCTTNLGMAKFEELING